MSWHLSLYRNQQHHKSINRMALGRPQDMLAMRNSCPSLFPASSETWAAFDEVSTRSETTSNRSHVAASEMISPREEREGTACNIAEKGTTPPNWRPQVIAALLVFSLVARNLPFTHSPRRVRTRRKLLGFCSFRHSLRWIRTIKVNTLPTYLCVLLCAFRCSYIRFKLFQAPAHCQIHPNSVANPKGA